MNKKEVLKEIELLIRSIKVHYDNLENESRIPTIELELITSKIRKLHEKSIVYNYLHYLEEGHHTPGSIPQRPTLKFQSPPPSAPHSKNIETAEVQTEKIANEFAGPAVEREPVKPIEPVTNAEGASVIDEKKLEEPAPVIKVVPIASVVSSAQQAVIGINFSGMLGINDKILFSRHLFGGNMEALMQCLQQLGACTNWKTAESVLTDWSSKYHWKKEDEVLENLIGMIRSKLH